MTGAAAALVLVACAGDPPPNPAPAAGAVPSGPCVLEQSPLVLADGTELYVEPQDLFRLGDEWMVVGSPTYQWSVAPERAASNVSWRAHVAAVLADPPRPLAKPLPGEIVGSMISTQLGDGRWAAIFDHVMADSVPRAAFPLAFWYGEHDGERWTRVEPLPTPPGATLDLRQSSALVRDGERLVWVSHDRTGAGPRLHRYERRDGVWRYEAMADRDVEYVVLQNDPRAGLLMALAGPDEGLPELRRSIRLYRDGPERTLISRVDTLPGGSLLLHLFVDVLDGDAAVSWVVSAGDGWRAFARTGITSDGAGPLVALDDNAPNLSPLRLPDGALAWLVEHEERTTRAKELRLLRLDGSRIVRAASAPSPFTGFFRAVPNGPAELLLVGPQMGLTPTETPVRSLILRLSTSC